VKPTTGLAVLLAAAVMSACVSAPPASSLSPAPSAIPSASVAVEPVWVSAGIDPAPGPTVTGGIAEALDGPADQVVAAVFLLRHPAGNGATVWVFRAGDLTSEEALAQWAAHERRCEGSPEHGTLAGREAVMIRRQFIDQCQPQYLVQLDDQTAAIITDDGAYPGNASDEPTLTYRSAEEIAWIVTWLQNELTNVELVPGGPPLVQG
jgi:hypothetical protein